MKFKKNLRILKQMEREFDALPPHRQQHIIKTLPPAPVPPPSRPKKAVGRPKTRAPPVPAKNPHLGRPKNLPGFRFASKLVFLTYSRCQIPLETMKDELIRICRVTRGERRDRIKWGVICAEDHADQPDGDDGIDLDDPYGSVYELDDPRLHITEHRHVVFFCDPRIDISNPRYFDIQYDMRIYHPKIVKPGDKDKDLKQLLEYLVKEDPARFIQWGEYKDAPFDIFQVIRAMETKKGYGFVQAAETIKKGGSIDEIDEEAPQFVLRYSHQLEKYVDYQDKKSKRKRVLPPFPGVEDVPIDHEEHHDWQQIVEWIRENFQPYGVRSPRQKQLWVWSGESGIGKSYFWMVVLSAYFNMYPFCPGDKQTEDVRDAQYLMMDEIKARVIPIDELKKLTQMYGYQFDVKYGRQFTLMKNIPIICTAQFSIRDTYAGEKEDDIKSLENRYLEVHVTKSFHIKLLPDVVLAMGPIAPGELDTPPGSPLVGSPPLTIFGSLGSFDMDIVPTPPVLEIPPVPTHPFLEEHDDAEESDVITTLVTGAGVVLDGASTEQDWNHFQDEELSTEEMDDDLFQDMQQLDAGGKGDDEGDDAPSSEGSFDPEEHSEQSIEKYYAGKYGHPKNSKK